MVVRNEEAHIGACLADIHGLFDQISITDNIPTDGTRALLADRFGIIAHQANYTGPFHKHEESLRNQTFEELDTDWILTLDADERVDREILIRFMESPDQGPEAGWFSRWMTYRGTETIEDYKLSLFCRGIAIMGRCHPNLQPEFRRQGLTAGWMEGMTIHHFPSHDRHADKMRARIEGLRRLADDHPDWHRYRWFLGYTLFQTGALDEALKTLLTVTEVESGLFPVECLNSAMVAAQLLAARGDQKATLRVLEQGWRFHNRQHEEFEVRVNWRMLGWFEQALAACDDGHLNEIKAYAFTY